MNKFYIITCLLFLTISIESHSQDNYSYSSFQGNVIDTIYCEHDLSQSYALYLPSYYSDSSSFPIVYFFEPRARGKLPVTLYKEVAESFGIILVGSNNSKNGPVQISYDAFYAVKKDTNKKFNIDSSRVFTSGFSGGGRLAQDIAFNDDGITGVIAVGGAQLNPNKKLSSTQKTLFVGLVGTKGMNYAEHITFARKLKAKKIRNNYFTYNLDHAWAPPEYFKQAIEWQMICSIQNNIDTPNTRVNNYVFSEIARADQLISSEPLKSIYIYRSLLFNFNSASLITTLPNKIKELEKLHKREIIKYDNQLMNEIKHQKEYEFAFFEVIRNARNPNMPLDSIQYNMKYWKNLISGLKKKIIKDSSNHRYIRELDIIRGQYHFYMKKMRSFNLPELEYTMTSIGLLLHPNSNWLLWNQYMIALVLNNKKYEKLAIKELKNVDPKKILEVKRKKHFDRYRDQFPDLYIME